MRSNQGEVQWFSILNLLYFVFIVLSYFVFIKNFLMKRGDLMGTSSHDLDAYITVGEDELLRLCSSSLNLCCMDKATLKWTQHVDK